MIILGTDTSSRAATAAISKDGVIICEYTLNIDNTHSEKLLPLIENMLKSASLTFEDIDVFAVGVGPGSFTGIRIGVATIRGFCGALSKKAVEVCSLSALAENVKAFDGIIISAIYARSDEVFCAAYKDGKEILAPCVMTISELLSCFLGEKRIIVGDACERFAEEIKRANDGNVFVSESEMNIIKGGSVCALALKKVENNDFTPYTFLAPLYLRKSQAEREKEENGGKK